MLREPQAHLETGAGGGTTSRTLREARAEAERKD